MTDNMMHIQNNALSLLLFDDIHSATIITLLPITAWVGDGALTQLVTAVYAYIETYNQAPKHHAEDIVTDLVNKHTIKQEKGDVLKQMIIAAESRYTKLTVEYVMRLINDFAKLAALKSTTQRMAEYVNAGRLEDADAVLQEHNKKQLNTIVTGSTMLDTAERLLMRDSYDTFSNRVRLAIKPLDRRDICLHRKTLFTVMGGPKSKKTFFLVHIGVRALLEGKRVLHVTLEVDENEVNTRYMQCFRSVVRRHSDSNTVLEIEPSFDSREINRPSLEDSHTVGNLIHWLKKDSYLNEFHRTVQFPSQHLTFRQFERCLDDFDRRFNFQPDVVILDYLPLMSTGDMDRRLGLDVLTQSVRGVAIERNLMAVTAWQATRESVREALKSGKRIEAHDAAEDYSIARHSDVLIVLQPQTELEERFGLMRMHAALVRNEQQNFEVMLTQHIPSAQFALRAEEMTPRLSESFDKFKTLHTREKSK